MTRLKSQKLLVIAPHPDDEVIGCGGLIKKIKDGGGSVFVLFLTVGNTLDFAKKGLSTSDERLDEIKQVSKYLKFDSWDLAFGGNGYHLKLDLLGQKALINVIERESKVAIEKIKPTIVAFPSAGSYNQDHRVAAMAAHAALRPASLANKHMPATVLAYESPADFWGLTKVENANFFVPLTAVEFDAKVAALKLYKSQMRLKPNPRSPEILRALAILRGSQCGEDLAEGFVALRNML